MSYSIIRKLVDLLYPPQCMFCRRYISSSSNSLICTSCMNQYGHAGPQYLTLPNGTKCFYALDYRDEARNAIVRFKFGSKPQYTRGFTHFLLPAASQFSDFDFITWVPISIIRHLKRTYNQTFILAESISKTINIPLVRTLKKVKLNRRQSSLNACERRKNVLDSFRTVNADRIKGARIILIDDIVTTGSTLSECTRVLYQAGAKEIVCLTVAH